MKKLGNPETTAKLLSQMSLPLIVAPMFLVSSVESVIASCKSGVMGTIPALNARTSEIFDIWLTEIGAALAGLGNPAPFAVNLIVHQTNVRLQEDLDLCVKHQVPIIIASVGSPARSIEQVHAYGGLVFSDAASIKHARRGAELGVDGLILLTAGAGGNTGWLNPFAFVNEVRQFFDGPIILAGSISNGRALYAAQVMGADMAASGTSFIAAVETSASSDYRDMLVESGCDDIILTSDVTGIPANYLRLSLERSGFVAGAEHQKFDLARELDTVKAWKDIWASGHGVGDVNKATSTAEIVDTFRVQYNDAVNAPMRAF